jgi:oxygen-independent coproporphyrinogen-3 oxidase
LQGIYIHIPFCRQACSYCNFHFTTSLRYRSELVEAICGELALRSGFNPMPAGNLVHTLYIGGGTPSLLHSHELERILDSVHSYFRLDPDVEITLEANPDDIDRDSLENWKRIGINRLSVGIQSFNDAELRWMNRAHDAEASVRCLQLIPAAGFDNYSVDLIYGSDLLDRTRWESHMDRVTSAGVPHVSCYALTVEPGTRLYQQIKKGNQSNPPPARQAEQFLQLMAHMRGQGYVHYEISNFCIPGRQSRHNSSYWENGHYLGIGPSAHSFDGERRSWNVADNRKYLQALLEGKLPPGEQETLSPVQRMNEYIMLSLRTDRGMEAQRLNELLGPDRLDQLERNLIPWKKEGKIEVTASGYRLTDLGRLFADGIAADLFFIE